MQQATFKVPEKDNVGHHDSLKSYDKSDGLDNGFKVEDFSSKQAPVTHIMSAARLGGCSSNGFPMVYPSATKPLNDSEDINKSGSNQGPCNGPLVCPVCFKVFMKRSRLVSHMLTHSEAKDHICPVCNKGFKNKPQLDRHSNTHSEVPRFCCNICGRGFKHNDVAKHVKRFHSGPRKSNRGGVANPFALKATNTFESDVNQDDVDSSSEPTQGLVAPHDHVIIQFQPDVERLSRGEDDQEVETQLSRGHQRIRHQPHDLRECNVDSASGNSSDSTTGDTDSTPVYPCMKCDRSFYKKKALASHMMCVHQGSDEGTKEVPKNAKHQCHLCLKTFTRASGLNGHLDLHSRSGKRKEPNPEFRCHICGKMFTRRTGLNAHILHHGGVLRYWCNEPDCGKGFVHSYQLKRHKIAHADVLPYSCHICGKSFRHNDLSKHMRIHTGDKPYRCQHCGKRFTFNSSLRSHERMHLAVQEHYCKVCSVGFSTSAGLQRHAKLHGVENLCSVCGELFPSKPRLTCHLRESRHCSQRMQQHQTDHEATQAQISEEAQQSLPNEQHVQNISKQNTLQHQVHVQPLPQMPDMRNLHDMQDNPQVSQPAHPSPIQVSHEPNQHPSAHHDEEATLAPLTASKPDQVPVHMPIDSNQVPVSSSNVGSLPLLVPFSVSVPISVPFGININSSPSDPMHFLSWEQKY